MYNPAIDAARAAAARRHQEEEEKMTTYNKEDLEGWEFKIVRSNIGRFRNYKRVQEVCAEEAKAGWELVEKFDDNRIRFKRRIEKRSNDQFLNIDPYRTTVGFKDGALAGIILLAVGVAIAVGVLVSGMAKSKGGGFNMPVVLPFIVIVAAVVVVIVTRLKR